MEAHEDTSTIKSAKLFICKGKFEKFALWPNEDLKTNFSRLNNIVNELKDLGFEVPDVDISHKFLRALPPKYETIVTLLVRSNLKETSPSEILGEILTRDIFKQSQEELHGDLNDSKKKIVAFKAKSSNDDSDDESNASTDHDVASMVERFKKFMKKKGYHSVHNKSGKSYGKNPFAKEKCFECGEMGHISTNCKNKDEENSSKSKKFEGKKKLFKKYNKKKNGKACYVAWESDASSDSDSNDDDDDVKPSKKGLAGISIKEAPSLFDTTYCLMAKGEPKVCDDDDEFSYDDLVEMVSNLDDLLGDMKGKYRDLKKKHASLQDSYEELKIFHENLLETHEKLKEAHNSHISQEANKLKVDVGITCDLLDDLSSIESISRSSVSTSCDDLLAIPCSSKVDSCMNDSITCDPLLIVENDELRNTVDCLTKALANCHRGENTYNKMWECQRFTLKHEGLGYIPKKNKSAFVDKKTTFMKECRLYCAKCKNTGHLEKDCIGNKDVHLAIDPSYVLVKSSQGVVYAKFVGKIEIMPMLLTMAFLAKAQS
jgi:hypothetical protein